MAGCFFNLPCVFFLPSFVFFGIEEKKTDQRKSLFKLEGVIETDRIIPEARTEKSNE